ncbi:hypothetical protein [Leifsonia xyli]|uniref:hypothetical protein n=1 Tax=Leifsonia xyli TaxID=1575 RepID=UPI0012FDF1CE
MSTSAIDAAAVVVAAWSCSETTRSCFFVRSTVFGTTTSKDGSVPFSRSQAPSKQA